MADDPPPPPNQAQEDAATLLREVEERRQSMSTEEPPELAAMRRLLAQFTPSEPEIDETELLPRDLGVSGGRSVRRPWGPAVSVVGFGMKSDGEEASEVAVADVAVPRAVLAHELQGFGTVGCWEGGFGYRGGRGARLLRQ